MLGNLFTSAGQLLLGQLGWVEQVIGGVATLVLCGFVALIGWNRRQRADRKPGMASFWIISACFAVALIAISCAAYGLGLRSSTASLKTETPRPDTRLRVRIDPAQTKIYLQDGESNIGNWQQTIVAMGSEEKNGDKKSIFHADTISMTFAQDIDYERPIIESFGHKLGGWNFYSLGRKGAVFQFYDSIQAPMIEIWFPPIGYYAEQSKKAAIGAK
jgi:hypothetical protein